MPRDICKRPIALCTDNKLSQIAAFFGDDHSIEFSVFKATILPLPQGNIQNVFGFKGDEFYLSGDTAILRFAHLLLPTSI